MERIAEQMPRSDYRKLEQNWGLMLIPTLFISAISVALYIGWSNRDEYLITPEWGTGYTLGIIGGVMFLLIFLYPLRKKLKMLRRWGNVKVWFNLHTLLGLLAPTIILYHCNFSLGATNSNMALFSMLLVVASGLVGRYIYAQVHYGLMGTHVELQELHTIRRSTNGQLGETFGAAPVLEAVILDFEKKVLERSESILQSVARKLSIGVRTWMTYFYLKRRIKPVVQNRAKRLGLSQAKQQQLYRDVCHCLFAHLSAIRKIAVFNFYEQVFAAWHVVHVVFFSLLVILSLLHVYAVHIY